MTDEKNQKRLIDQLLETVKLLQEQNSILKNIMRTHGIELPDDKPTVN